ncbi:MAG TPA: phosphoethanolamine transferase [Cellvibrio sp.]|nr:phosphoethanolamine transferase [Cellvibrio sp.]
MNSTNSQYIENSVDIERRDSTAEATYSISNIHVSSLHFAMILSGFFVILFNKSFFGSAWSVFEIHSVSSFLFSISLIPVLWLITLFFIYLICIPVIAKPLSIALLVGGAFSAYFMDTYGVVIDKEMLRNTLETDSHESLGLFSTKLIAYVFILGLLPSWMVLKVRIIWNNPWSEIVKRLLTLTVVLIASLMIVLSLSSFYSSFFRNHKEVRFLANPLGFTNAAISLANEAKKTTLIIEPISQDARLGMGTLKQSKPVLVVMVVGETARAANFGVDGYERNTTPLLSKKDIIYFNKFSSCGTSTAVSLPCIFSTLSRKEYKDTTARSRHGLMDFIQVAGVDVLWRENNSGCKGVCDRVPHETFKQEAPTQWCKEGNCYDEVLLHELDRKVSGNPQIIVLHQNGSHGPAYDQRYPESMRFYTPVCQTNQLQNCTREEVVNAYDNTIRYTDHFLTKVVEWLQEQQKTHNVAMMYVSDHGESLGENRIYLHGMPYAIAPEFQTRVPFVFWASSGFYHDRGLAKECLSALSNNVFSHDNIFHSVLGLVDIQTKYYQPELDIFYSCIDRG